MKRIYVSNRADWRSWLAENHDKENAGIWLVFFKGPTGKPSVGYEEAVEEALCFGWIDSLVKSIDKEKYCIKFAPRKSNSKWSESNKRRVEKVIKEGRMTEFGLAKVDVAKRSGNWEKMPHPPITTDLPSEMWEALARDRKAWEFFEKLAPTYRKQFIGWVVSAKREETKAKRLQEAMVLLARGEKLGLK
jgi:uncharacterized protein YdeI (YjbR/CyaY-like superfamily)